MLFAAVTVPWVIVCTLLLPVELRTEPPTSFHNRIVFFGSAVGDSTLIQAMNPDGSGLETVLKLDGPILAGLVSPDGTSLAFTGKSDSSQKLAVWLRKSDGTLIKLTDDGGIVRAWSPDSRKVAYYSGEAGKWQSFVVDTQTLKIEQLPIPSDDVVEDWSPDGQLLSVMAGRLDQRFKHSTKGTYPLRGIYTMRIDGSNKQALTADPACDAIWSRFSPDGSRIAHYLRRYPDDVQSPLEISVVRESDGDHARELATFAQFNDEATYVRPAGPPRWSPDGKTLVWRATRQSHVDTARRDWELIFITLEDGTHRRLPLATEAVRFWGSIDWR